MGIQSKLSILVENKTEIKMNKKTELSYNGWANRETWLISVWEYIDYFVDTYYDNEEKPDDVDSRDLQSMFEDIIEMPRSGIESDLMGSALSLIDWYEIEEHVKRNLEEKIMDNF